MFERVTHPGFEQGSLEAVPAQFRDSRRAAEEGDPFMERQRSCRSGLTIQLGDELHTVFARECDRAEFLEKTQQLGILVRPAPRTDVRPQCSILLGQPPAPSPRGRLSRAGWSTARCITLLSSIGRYPRAHSKSRVATPARGLTSCTTAAPRSRKKRSILSNDSGLNGSKSPRPKLCVTGESTPSKTA